MQRIQGLAELTFSKADVAVKTGEGYLYSITLSWTGATAGDQFVIRDGLDGAGTVLVPIVLSAATGTLQLRWDNGKRFVTGLYLDQQGAVNPQGEITYK